MIRRLLAYVGLTLCLHASAMAQARQAAVSATLNYSALQPGQQEVIAVVVDIGPGLHAQSRTPLDKNLIPFEVTLESNPAVTVLPIAYPPGDVHDYPALGKMSVYTGRAVVYVPLEVKSSAPIGPITLKGSASYQFCVDRL
jgi:DsbC/DsbD-like thiol-disulfide interchange protein